MQKPACACHCTNRKYLFIFFAILSAVMLGVRFFGTPEDTWLCNDGTWVKHGNPAAPMPEVPCP
ncbi:MAG: hypothetical protein PHU04_05420 [Candidatus Peribacteraceae bacterium]|nr:hypothetical protein [Candidatus Peribacteraceae bacterium]